MILGSPPEENGKNGRFHFSAGSTAGLAQMPTATAAGNIAMTSGARKLAPLKGFISNDLDVALTSPIGTPGPLGIGAQQQRRSRSEKRPIPDTEKDGKYFERRNRNNLAAKKSRDSRKQREDQIACRAQWFERENAILRAQVQTLREVSELSAFSRLRTILFKEAQSLRQLVESRQQMQHSVKMQHNMQSFAMNGFHVHHT
jgi:hypothetical protein